MGLFLVVFPSMGLLALALVAVWSFGSGRGRTLLGGALAGAGGCWLVLAARAEATQCAGSSPGDCGAPDLRPFVVFAVLMLVAGTLLMWHAERRTPTAE